MAGAASLVGERIGLAVERIGLTGLEVSSVGERTDVVATAGGVVAGLVIEKTVTGVLAEISARGGVFCALCSARCVVF